ncbi:hypothetical protein P4U03_30565 [Bacillus mycoides]|uniref:Uncharacterized protein n=1 Tax=Bacillus thuringiensis serovar navarrensis TaxID=339658 RepID=A0A243AJE8_BACTU|nr:MULTISPECIES: hypothetical protein [Bacillus cereus group]MED1270807.1 hypothetical protein [Bacillus mycoides]OFD35970.1 hypothetical protein BWGOE3_57390 [Bacillus mycoides]OFD36195.1 hypothetical protein BWGOE2_55330 [Bacillus mycoides]OFD52982.1 hypothetical protein BWGOE4_55390 [Bacillus mycoides]OFD53180.1 hypothetical protein BWGOE6_56360 [Bacillus mycoides]
MKKLPIVLCTLGLSIGLLGTSVVGATSDSSKSFAKMEISNNTQDKNEGVQPRWAVSFAKGFASGVAGAAAAKAATNGFGKSSADYSGYTCGYASAGGMVGGHAPEMEIEEFGR